MNRSDIFVSIASYRDPELIPTLKDMIASAAHPENLHIAVCWQDEGDFTPFIKAGFRAEGTVQLAENTRCFTYCAAQITIIYRHYFQSEGACWARHLCETLYRNEAYFLQIDSHCRFAKQWDNQMIAMLQSLIADSPQPVLSAYPPGYQPGEDEKRQQFVNRMIFREFTKEGIPMAGSKNFTASRPERGSYLAGGFIFSHGKFVTDVANDPQIFFAGEEIAMAVRAFTCGYDVYHPHQPLIWHYYQRAECPKVWQDHDNDARERGEVSHSWWQRDQRSKQRIATLLGLTDDNADTLAPYGPGKVRTLREFEYQTGLLFRLHATQPAVTDARKQAFFADKPVSESAWLASFSIRYDKHISLPLSELSVSETPYQFIQMGVYDKDNLLLYSQRLDPPSSEEDSALPSARIHVTFSTHNPCAPASIRFCGWHAESGWGSLTEQAW